MLMAPAESESAEVDEGELVARAQEDDSTAFRELFDRFYPMIYSFCYRACLDQPGAQDVAQETFIKAARAMGTFRLGSSFKAWLYRIAANTARDWQRDKARQGRLSEIMAESRAESALAVQPDYSRVTEALHALPDDLRFGHRADLLRGNEPRRGGAGAGMRGNHHLRARVPRQAKAENLLSRKEAQS